MDERLNKALDIANYMTTVAGEKRAIYEEYLQNSVYFYNGFSFKVTRELINYINTLLTLNQTDSVVLDDNSLPVYISDLQEFLNTILSVHSSALNEYHTKYQKIKNNRSVESLLDL